MCFYPSTEGVEFSTGKRVKIAKEDIITFKVMIYRHPTKVVHRVINSIRQLEKHLMSPHFSYNYKMRTLYKHSNCDLKRGKDIYIVDRAYHSYFTFPTAINDAWGSATIVRCIIPKGSLYAVNSGGEVVSNKIILNDVVYTLHIIENISSQYICNDDVRIGSIKRWCNVLTGSPYDHEIYKQL